MSNYPQSFGSFQCYGGYGGFQITAPMNSGPPPPPMGGFGGFGGGGYGHGGFQQSGYNNYGGYNSGFNCPAVQQMSGGYPMGNQPPPQPPQPPMSYSHQPFVQHQTEMNMQRYIYQEMGYKKPKKPKPQIVEEGQVVEEEDEEEDEQDAKNRQIDENVKEKMKKIYVDELMRRYTVTSTFELANGVVVPMVTYPEDDMVVAFYKAERKTDLAGEPWDAEADCEYLNVAMKGPGTTESIITHIVATRCNAQRQELKRMFPTLYGKDLVKEIKSELSGDYKNAILACFVSPAEFDVRCIKKAIYGLGTDEQTLIEILMTRTNKQIQEIRAVYGSIAKPDKPPKKDQLDDDIRGDTSGDFKRLLVSACQGNRNELTRAKVEAAVEEILNANGDGTGMFELNYSKLIHEGKAKRDAEFLHKAGEDRWGTDEETFNRIFAVREFYQLRAIYSEYVKLSQSDIRHAIDSETSGNYKKGLYAIASSVMNRPKYLAERLVKAMKGLGTDEDTLIRIIASRSEIDMVQIKEEFLELTRKTLYRYIQEDTSFNFKKILCALVGKN